MIEKSPKQFYMTCPDWEPSVECVVASGLILLPGSEASRSLAQKDIVALEPIWLQHSKDERASPPVNQEVSQEEADERLDSWMASRERLIQELSA